MTLALGLKSVIPAPIGSVAKVVVAGVCAYLVFTVWRPEARSPKDLAPAERRWREIVTELDHLAHQTDAPSDRAQMLQRQLYDVESVLGDHQVSRLHAEREARERNAS